MKNCVMGLDKEFRVIIDTLDTDKNIEEKYLKNFISLNRVLLEKDDFYINPDGKMFRVCSNPIPKFDASGKILEFHYKLESINE